MRAAEQQHPDGTSSVTLICSSHSYPPVSYSWYKKTEEKERAIKVSSQRNFTVYSDKPGIYYCIAKNEINQRSSDPVELFVDREWMQGHVSVYCFYKGCFVKSNIFPSAVWNYATCSQMYLHTDTLSSNHRRLFEARLPFSDYPARRCHTYLYLQVKY